MSQPQATGLPSSGGGSGSGGGAGTPAVDPTPCRECRRRRVKCDGTMPVCAVCQKYRRHCLYDKHSKTRLTRRQLTILETRLEKAEALLRSHFTQTQLAEMMDGAATAIPASATANGNAATPSPHSVSAAAGTAGTNPSVPGMATSASGLAGSSQLPIGIEFGMPMDPGSRDAAVGAGPGFGSGPAAESTVAAGPPSSSYELAPSVADDFEWNEQESSWSSVPGSGMDAGPGETPQAIMDGMASLSVGERRGYLGSVSGAALLRQILSARKDGESSNGGDPPRHLDHLFQHHPDPSQWFRAQSMLSRAAVENLIDAFFHYYHPTFPVVHEPTFRAQYAGALPRPDRDKWKILANVLTALGSFASSNCADATDLPIFQGVQKALFADNLETGNLTLVQAFALSASYLQKRNKPNSGYNYGGLAIRLGIGLGLHKEFDSGNVSPLQMEIRRRVWWVLCVLDVGATITYGRPLNWPQAGIEAKFPRNMHEKSWVSNVAPAPPEVDGLTLYTYIRVQSAYHLSTMNIYNRLITGVFPEAAELVALDDQYVGAWLAQVPPYYLNFPPAGSEHALGLGITQWRYRNLRIVMYRPFLIRWALSPPPPSSAYGQQALSTADNMAVSRCLDAAKETISSIGEYWMTRSHSRLAAWYVLYFLFHATLIPVHCLRHNSQHSLTADWRAQIRSSLAVMEGMSDLSTNSSKCREICLKLCWPHLQDDRAQLYSSGDGDGGAFAPNLGEGEAASMMNSYDAWCEVMSDTRTAVPMFQWANIDEQGFNFFY